MNVLAHIIEETVDRDGDIYGCHKDYQIELTMSCDPDEAKGWLYLWMMEAIAGGNGAPDQHLRAKYLAAYDTYQELLRQHSYSGRDYSPGNPWDAPGMSVRDFI